MGVGVQLGKYVGGDGNQVEEKGMEKEGNEEKMRSIKVDVGYVAHA